MPYYINTPYNRQN